MLPLRPFRLERYFAQHEFTTPHLLCASDCATLTVGGLLELAALPPSTLLDTSLGYTETAGGAELRAAIAARHGGVVADDVVVAAPQELIFLALSSMVSASDKVVVSTPCYGSLLEVPRALGADVVEWPVEETADGWRFDLERLASLLDGARTLVVNTPHNPTGAHLDRAQLNEVLSLCRARDVRVFCDEMYRGLEPAGTPTPPSATELDASAVTLSGLSKSHGLPGLRIGWLLCRDEDTRARVLQLKDYTTICPPAPCEALARVALRCEAALLDRNRLRIADNTRALVAVIERHPSHLEWRAPRAGPIAFVRVSSSADALADRARERGVLLLPSSELSFGDRHLRFGLGRDGFGVGLRLFDELLSELA